MADVTSKQVRQLLPGDVLHGSRDTIVSVAPCKGLRADTRKAIVVTTHPKYGRRVRTWSLSTHVGVVTS